MQLPNPVTIVGVEGSPYSRKLRAVLRYRRIPHLWVGQGSGEARSLPQPKVGLIPQLLLVDEQGELVARTDTTPLIRWLETQSPDRSVRPSDPALAFLDSLLEDFADEWLTKAMFHYRWAFPESVANATELLPRWFSPARSDEVLAPAGQAFAQRQVDRLAVVGSSSATAPTIENSFLRTLRLLDEHLSCSRFLLGSRPASCDFAFFGQLTQLTRVDPAAAQLAHQNSLRVVAWTDLQEDLSGVQPQPDDWTPVAPVSASLRALLAEVGRVYVPFLLANAHALAAGASELRCQLDGRLWVQKPFAYQGKCLAWLREEYAGLAPTDRDAVDAALAGTGCEPLFAPLH